MKKNIKKLPLMLFALGSVITPILLTTVLSNNFYLTSNENVKLDSINQKNIPNLKSEFTKAMADKLIDAKIADNADWDGSLIASDFPPGITSIGFESFRNNVKIKSIVLPDTVLQISNWAFRDTTTLTSISAPSVTAIGLASFYRSALTTINFPAAEIINATAFSESPNLITINLPAAIAISPGAFYGMDKLSSISMPNAELIGDNAFGLSNNLINISLPTATFIGMEAFAISGLQTLELPAATSISRNAFKGANAIQTGGIKLTKNENIDISKSTLWGVNNANKLNFIDDANKFTKAMATQLIIDKKTADPTWNGSLTASDFPVNITSIGTNAFINNTEVKSITLPNTVKTIDQNAFQGCTALTTISAVGTTNIGTNAFTGLTSIINGGIKLTKSKNINIKRYSSWGANHPNMINITPEWGNDAVDQNNLIIIISASVGGVLLIAAAGIGGFLYYRKKKSDEINIEPQSDLEEILD